MDGVDGEVAVTCLVTVYVALVTWPGTSECVVTGLGDVLTALMSAGGDLAYWSLVLVDLANSRHGYSTTLHVQGQYWWRLWYRYVLVAVMVQVRTGGGHGTGTQSTSTSGEMCDHLRTHA